MTELESPHSPYMRIVTLFDQDETAASFLSEDGDGGFAGGVWRMAREIDRLRANLSPSPSQRPAVDVVEAIAQKITEWLGYSWGGLLDGSVVERGLPIFTHGQFGWGFQGHKDDMRVFAREIAALASLAPQGGEEQPWQKPGERAAQGSPADEQSGETSHGANPAQLTDAVRKAGDKAIDELIDTFGSSLGAMSNHDLADYLRRIPEAIERAIAAIDAASPARVTDTNAAEVLKPFTTFAAEAIERSDALWVWKSNIFRDRVCDWFGPSDFGALLHFSETLTAAMSTAPIYDVTKAAASIAAMVAEWYDSAPHAPHIPAEIIAKRISRFATIGAGGQSYAQIVEPYAAAQRMIRDAIQELFGPIASLESEDATLLRGPEPHHEAEAQIDALMRVRDQIGAGGQAVADEDPECTDCGGTGITYQTERPCACKAGKWSYSINYGPDGEEDWANLITPEGDHVANIRIHHARRILSALSQPHPADERVVEVLRETADALETLLSADPDMPTYQSDYDAADQQLERARAVLSAKEGRNG